MADVPPPQTQANDAENVQAQIAWATRAPTSKDKGLIWAHDKTTTVDLYVRSKISGAWKKATFS